MRSRDLFSTICRFDNRSKKKITDSWPAHKRNRCRVSGIENWNEIVIKFQILRKNLIIIHSIKILFFLVCYFIGIFGGFLLAGLSMSPAQAKVFLFFAFHLVGDWSQWLDQLTFMLMQSIAFLIVCILSSFQKMQFLLLLLMLAVYSTYFTLLFISLFGVPTITKDLIFGIWIFWLFLTIMYIFIFNKKRLIRNELFLWIPAPVIIIFYWMISFIPMDLLILNFTHKTGKL